MAFEQRSLDDYIDVAQRIADFRDKYPEGTLGPANKAEPYKILQVEGFEKNGDVLTQTFIVVVAAAARFPHDDRPGIGMAWEIFPGRTPYTRGSELQNAETSAWGRAIIAVGASDSKRGIASREEVRNRQAERDDGLPVNRDGSTSRSRVTDEQLEATGQMTKAQLAAHNKLEREVKGSGPQGVERSTGPVVDDRWTTDAPSWLVGVDPPEDQPGSILPAQRSQIMAVYTALGIKDRDKRMADVCDFLEMTVASVNDLSHQQAARLLENLHERHTGKMTCR